MNPITKIKPFDSDDITSRDLLGALIVDCGGSVSDMPRKTEGITYTDEWEYFDPEKVIDVEDLPDYWGMVYKMHTKPDMGDCRYLRYKYVHIPIEIICQYPRAPVKGIFCLACNVDKKPDEIKANDLIWIGNEFEE